MTDLDVALLPALCTAVEDGSLRLVFQPEVDLHTGSITGMEALLRWQHPDLGLLRPAQFFSVAEVAGLVGQLGRWVLRTGVAEARVWQELRAWSADRPPRLWLNISAAQLTRPGFHVEIERLVHGRALPPGALGLEFTEETLGLAHVGVPKLLGRLRSLGPAIAVDDFGTWYASLATLDTLPLDVVKLDQRFVRAMVKDLEGEAVLASVISMAHRRAMIVVAEGVETLAEAARLSSLGCDRAFGMFFCEPVPPERAREIVGTGRVDGAAPRPAHAGAGAAASSGAGSAGTATAGAAAAAGAATGTAGGAPPPPRRGGRPAAAAATA